MTNTDFEQLDRQIKALIRAYDVLKREHSSLQLECEKLRNKKQQVRRGIESLVQQLKETQGVS